MSEEDLLKAVSDKICNLLKDTKHQPFRLNGILQIKEAEVLAALELTDYRFRFSMAVDCIIVEGRSRCSWKLGELLIDQDWVTLDFLYDELLIDND